MAAIAGKVAITPKGEWDVATQYEKLDFVLYGDDSYVARKESVGVEPGTDDEVWMLSLRGASAQQIQDIINGTTTVGNADKLDGYHAEDFAKSDKFISGATGWVAMQSKNSETGMMYRLQMQSSGNVDLHESNDNGATWTKKATWNKEYLPLSGGTLTGDVDLKKVDNGYGKVQKNHSETVDYGTYLRDYDASGGKAYLSVKASAKRATFGADDTEYILLHTGNKPTGTYTGNGDATERQIATGGIGYVILLWSGSSTFLVIGTLALQFLNNAWSKVDGIKFLDGTLTLTTTGTANGNGSTIRYQVL